MFVLSGLAHYIEPIAYGVFLSFLTALFFLKKSGAVNKLLFLILLNYTITEVVCIFLKYNHHHLKVGMVYNMSIFLQFVCWFVILGLVTYKNKLFLFGLPLLQLLFAFLGPLCLFNPYNFILGSFTYLILYIYECQKMLVSEKIGFFTTPHFLLITSPILFFLGMSFLFAFESHEINSTLIIGHLTLYNFINYFVNGVYYLLLLTYIYKIRSKTRHD